MTLTGVQFPFAAILWAVMRRGLVIGCLLVLTGCRVDVVVDLVVEADGTGELVVTAVADAEVVEQAPGLATDLRLDDAVAAGWAVEGPMATADGGLQVSLRHPVASPAEATNLLASLGPPFTDVRLATETVERTTTVSLAGRLMLPAAFDSFADADLLAAVGGTPYADDLAASGATPATSMSITFGVVLPGDIEETTAAEPNPPLQWEAPLDGSVVDLTTRSVQRPSGSWASILAVSALVLLVAWVVVSGAVVLSVIRTRRRVARRRGLTSASAGRLEDLDRPL